MENIQELKREVAMAHIKLLFCKMKDIEIKDSGYRLRGGIFVKAHNYDDTKKYLDKLCEENEDAILYIRYDFSGHRKNIVFENGNSLFVYEQPTGNCRGIRITDAILDSAIDKDIRERVIYPYLVSYNFDHDERLLGDISTRLVTIDF